jgi:hypothetical protein
MQVHDRRTRSSKNELQQTLALIDQLTKQQQSLLSTRRDKLGANGNNDRRPCAHAIFPADRPERRGALSRLDAFGARSLASIKQPSVPPVSSSVRHCVSLATSAAGNRVCPIWTAA